MSEWHIVVPDRLPPPADIEQAVFGPRARVSALMAHTEAELVGRIEDADAILAWHELRWTREVLGSLKHCKALVRVGVGFDNVDLAFARERGIIVCNVPDYGTHDVADHAMALLLALARGLPGHDRAVRAGPEHWRWGVTPTFRLTDKVLGIVGLGRIGAATALRAKAFGLRVAFYDPYRPAGWDKALGLGRFDSLEELARESDVVSLHTPLTAETRNMIGRQFFAACKPGMSLVNTARGALVEWPAFREAFDAGIVASAGFDVLPEEPLNRTDPLIERWLGHDPAVRDRLVITPHAAFWSVDAMNEMRRKAAEEALRILLGQPPRNPVP
ncbi:MAG TPA: C-terminal binding protein [Solimonas sp.]|nr:C-terminal binding protein [Solimonas sp.]